MLNPSMIKLSDLDKPDRYAHYRDTAIDKARKHAMSRRVHLGPFITVVFESEDTVLHRVQESIFHNELNSVSDMQNEIELHAELIPQPGTMIASLHVDFTSAQEVDEWLPKLQGVEEGIHIGFSDGALLQAISTPAQATIPVNSEVKSKTRHLYWHLTPQQRILFADGSPTLTVIHPGYSYQVSLPGELHATLFREVSGTLI